MKPIKTHYDNLKVARDAPTEVIRAAYRALAQRYHPDVNPSPDAARVMRILNEAWETLGNTQRRIEHDRWIREQEQSAGRVGSPTGRNDAPTNAAPTYTYNNPADTPPWQGHQAWGRDERTAQTRYTSTADTPSSGARRPNPRGGSATLLDRLNGERSTRVIIGFLVAASLLYVFAGLPTTSPPPTYKSEDERTPSAPAQSPQQEGHSFTAPAPSTLPEAEQSNDEPPSARWTPNGRPWPNKAAYLQGMPKAAKGGLSKLTIDNTNGGADVYVKLCRAHHDRCAGLRHVYIPLGNSFTLSNIASGTYDIRYRDLDSGRIAKSEPISLAQKESDEGTRFSVVRLTLYRVTGGNTTFTPLSEDQF